MANLTLTQTERRSYTAPIVLALLLLGTAIAALLHYTPRSTATISIPHLTTWHTRTVFKNETIKVARDTSQDDLYVVATLRIDDHLKLPLFLKDLTATMVTAEGETLSTSAIEKADLTQLLFAYPPIKSLTPSPLFRDTEIAPDRSAEGAVILHFPITEAAWQRRRSAAITVDFYHQPPQTVPLATP